MNDYIKIVGKDTKYINAQIIPVSDHVIRVTGMPQTTAGLEFYNGANDTKIGDYTKYITVYRVMDEILQDYEYSDDGSVYVAPVEPKPTPVSEPTEEDLLQRAKDACLAMLSDTCKRLIEEGQDITLADGSVDHFNYSYANQMNLKNAFDIAYQTKESVPYYDQDNICKIYSAQDIMTVYASCQSYITYNTTLLHQLQAQVKEMTDKDAVNAIAYSYDSLDGKYKSNFDAIIAQAEVILKKIMG